MAKANVIFHALLFDPSGAGTDESHIVSKIVFDVELEGKIYSHLIADIKRPMTREVDDEALEVVYDLPFVCNDFPAAAKMYYQTVLGPQGAMVTPSGPKGLLMQNNVFRVEMAVNLEVEDIAE